MLKFLTTFLFTCVLLVSTLQGHATFELISSSYTDEVISSNHHHDHKNHYDDTRHQHVELNENEEEEDSEQNSELDDKISYLNKNSINSIKFSKNQINKYETNQILQRQCDVWRPPQNS